MCLAPSRRHSKLSSQQVLPVTARDALLAVRRLCEAAVGNADPRTANSHE